MSNPILDDSYPLDNQHQQTAYNELLPLLPKEEELLWSAQPVQGLLWNTGDGIFGCFGLFLLGLGIPFVVLLLSNAAPFWIYLLAFPFLLLGFYLFLGHFFYNKWERAHSFYGLSNTHLWTKEGSKITTLPLHTTGHWQKYPLKNRQTWVWRVSKEPYSEILVVLGDLPDNTALEQQLLAMQQEIMVKKKKFFS